MKDILNDLVISVVKDLGIPVSDFSMDRPPDGERSERGNYSSNVAMISFRKFVEFLGTNVGEITMVQDKNSLYKTPKELAEEIKKKLEKIKPDHVDRIEIAGPGFINFFLKPEFFTEQVKEILKQENEYGKNNQLDSKRVMIEFTDPNPFKQFHIGHLMSNSIGESIARLHEWNGADVIRANYQGDVGPHVAKCIWGMMQHKSTFPHDTDDLFVKTKYLGDAYVYGATQYKENENIKSEIDDLNKKIYSYIQKNKEYYDEDIHVMYSKGREWSLEHFEQIYKELGTKFDHYFFESNVFEKGQDVVREQLEKGIFQESEGAIVFKGEDYGLHTRVFISSRGTPTYEAKDIGLAVTKESTENFDTSIVVTANEQTEYFKVVYKAIEQFLPEIAEKTKHIEHGMMRFADGKMSSRDGNIVTGESLLNDLKDSITEKMNERNMSESEKNVVIVDVAVGALKYSILRQNPGKNIIFDHEKALSTEGDSGPYIQYTTVRAGSILKKAEQEGIEPNFTGPTNWETTDLECKLYQFPEIVQHAYSELAPQHIVTYITELAGMFNSFYASTQIVDSSDESSSYKIALTKSTQIILSNGLSVLGIKVPDKM